MLTYLQVYPILTPLWDPLVRLVLAAEAGEYYIINRFNFLLRIISNMYFKK